VVAYRSYRAATGARGVVAAYFAALQRGDAANALGLGTVPVGPHELLTPAVLAAQQALAPISDVHVGAETLRGARGTVHVTYVVGFRGEPQPQADDVPVVRRGGAWWLARSAVITSFEMTSAEDRADILGRSVPLDQPVLVFPGAVPLHFDSPYLAPQAVQDYVTFATGTALSLLVQLSDAGRRAVVTAVDRALRDCLTSSRPDPACPLPDGGFVPGTIHGSPPPSVDKDLVVSVASGPEGLLDISGSVPVRGTYERLTYANVARPGRGGVTLDVSAHAYAVEPLRLQWSEP
jgi:hypothetical protein